MKRLITILTVLLYNLNNYAIDPNGVRVDHFDRGSSSSGGGGGGGAIIVCMVIALVAYVLFSLLTKSSTPTRNTPVYKETLTEKENRRIRQVKEDAAEMKGCLLVIVLSIIGLIVLIINNWKVIFN